jgi:hypothetical protein
MNCVVMFSTPWVVAEIRELQIIRKVIKSLVAWIFLYNQVAWDCVYDWFYPVITSTVLFQGKLVFLKCHITSKVTQLLLRASNLTLPGGQNLLLLYLSVRHNACCMKLSCDLFYLTLKLALILVTSTLWLIWKPLFSIMFNFTVPPLTSLKYGWMIHVYLLQEYDT